MKKKLLLTFLALWFGMGTVILGQMHSWHLVSFKSPETLPVIENTHKAQGLMLGHFLGAGCSCSEHIISYLLERGPKSETKEYVVLIGDFQERAEALKKAGFEVISKEFHEVQEEGLNAVPLLTIFSEDKVVQYAGGYTLGAVTPLSEFRDLKILAKLQKKQKAEALPLRGCAVSREYQTLLDPMGLKYGSL